MKSILEIEIEIQQVKQDVVNCRKCELCKTRKNPVVGNGSFNASVMFIGEAPGYHEDMPCLTLRPLVLLLFCYDTYRRFSQK